MFPYVRADPGTTHVPVGPLGVTRMKTDWAGHSPDVGIMSQAPTLIHAIVGLGGKFT